MELRAKEASFILDKDTETLAEYLKRIKPGSGSVVCELHFNAAGPAASGIEALTADNPTSASKMLAADMAASGAVTMGIPNRGVKTESESHRGKLGLMREPAGIIVLVEVCFITNINDLHSYFANKQQLAKAWADLLIKYDAKFT
jgi:N-acetylmuramoyl-L-alanine amidase